MPTDIKPTEAQRRRAALWWHLGSDEWPGSVYQWVKSGCVDDLLTHKEVLPQAAQLIATIESEADARGYARGVEEAAKVAQLARDDWRGLGERCAGGRVALNSVEHRIRALLWKRGAAT